MPFRWFVPVHLLGKQNYHVVICQEPNWSFNWQKFSKKCKFIKLMFTKLRFRYLWQLRAVNFLHRCLICASSFIFLSKYFNFLTKSQRWHLSSRRRWSWRGPWWSGTSPWSTKISATSSGWLSTVCPRPPTRRWTSSWCQSYKTFLIHHWRWGPIS